MINSGPRITDPPAYRKGFRTTHRRADGIEAMLICVGEGIAAYRVRFIDGTKLVNYTTACTANRFFRLFSPIGDFNAKAA